MQLANLSGIDGGGGDSEARKADVYKNKSSKQEMRSAGIVFQRSHVAAELPYKSAQNKQ